MLILAAGAALVLGDARLHARQDGGKDEGTVRFEFTGEVELTLLVNYVRDQLNIQIIYADAGLQGQKVVLTAPVTVAQDKVLQFLTFLLEQKNYTIIRNDLGIYMIVPTTGLQGTGLRAEDSFSSTQVIICPGIKPSSLSGPIQALGAGGGGTIVPLDEFGVLLVTDTPRRTQLIRDLVERLVKERDQIVYQRFEIQHIAASTALERILSLLGESAGPAVPGAVPQPQPGAKTPAPDRATGTPTFGASGGTSNPLPYQLSVDAQSNALLFHGRPADARYLESLLQIVDAPNSLVSHWYPVGGRTAEAVAAAAAREGLGEVTVYESTQGNTGGPNVNIGALQLQQQNQQPQGRRPQGAATQQQPLNGSGFVIYPESGGFMYHGTPTQHDRVKELIDNLAPLTENEQVVFEFYKLKHAKAEDVADIIQNLLSNQVPSGNRGSILGSDLSRGGERARQRRERAAERLGLNQPTPNQPARPETSSTEQAALSGDENTFVLADDKNNQIIVKAVKRLQPQFQSLINRIDLRRPQVYIDAKIVAINANSNFRLAVETQIVAGQFGLNTNFNLSSFGDTGGITGPKTVANNLPALTAAVINSKYVPIILTALQNNTNGRVLATPQLLVDANEEAEVSSVNRVPTQVTSQTAGTPTVTSVGPDAEAGTRLTVTPQISESAVKLQVDIEESTFVGSAASPGLPPPSLVNQVNTASVTVPPDATIVIGGLTLESDQDTVIKVPLLGDIPIIGHLFRDTSKTKQSAVLYVFITPTIMRDPNFADLRLLTKGPLDIANLESADYVPPPEPVKLRILETPPPRETDAAATDTKRKRPR